MPFTSPNMRERAISGLFEMVVCGTGSSNSFLQEVRWRYRYEKKYFIIMKDEVFISFVLLI
jgi:hypothetical protein